MDLPQTTGAIQRQQANGETDINNPSGAYGPTSSSGTYEPVGEREFLKMFVTDRSRAAESE